MNNLDGKPGFEELTAHLRERPAALRARTHHAYQYNPGGIPRHPAATGNWEPRQNQV